MKPYGIKRKDRGCCPGHDKFPKETYTTRTSQKAKRRDTKYAHGRQRMINRLHVIKQLNEIS